MRLIFVASSFFLLSAVANASDLKAICPSAITCDYDSGVCNMPSGWDLVANNGSTDVFSGEIVIGLSQISAYKTGFAPNEISYQMACSYKYSEHFFIYFTRTVQALTGNNWIFSGFGKSEAKCSDITDPTTCAGGNQFKFKSN
jgi:hypothetical protein